MPKKITAKDEQTGRTVTFDWNGDKPPTDADMAEVFKAAGTQQPVAPPVMTPTGPVGMGATSDAPDQPGFMAKLAGQMEGAAHPQSLGDVGTLLAAPTDATRSVMASLIPRATAAIKAAASDSNGLRGVATSPFRAISKFSDALPSNNEEAVSQFFGPKGSAPTPEPIRVNQGAPDIWDRVGKGGSETPPPRGGIVSTPPMSDAEYLARAGRPRGTLRPVQTPPPNQAATAPAIQPSGVELNEAATAPTQPLAAPRLLARKPYTENFRSTDVKPNGLGVPWESGAESGSADALSAARLHKSDAELAARWKVLMDNKNATWLLGMAPPAEAAREALIAHLKGSDE